MGPLPGEGGFFSVTWVAHCRSGVSLPSSLWLAGFQLPDHLDEGWQFGAWLGWQGKSKMDLLGRVPCSCPAPSPPRSIKTRSQDGAGSQGNSSACWSWQRGPWHLLHPGSLVRWGHAAPGKAGLHSHLYFELRAFISVQGKSTTI